MTAPVDLMRWIADGIPGSRVYEEAGSLRVVLADTTDRVVTQAEIDAAQAQLDARIALLVQLGIDKADLASQYQIGIDRLTEIRNTASFSNTTRDNALRDLALIMLRLAKVVRALII